MQMMNINWGLILFSAFGWNNWVVWWLIEMGFLSLDTFYIYMNQIGSPMVGVLLLGFQPQEDETTPGLWS
jgi:hypothetical protein